MKIIRDIEELLFCRVNRRAAEHGRQGLAGDRQVSAPEEASNETA
jgi:hypothetical protein